MKFEEVKNALAESGLRSSNEALSKILANEIAIELDSIACDEIIDIYERLAQQSEIQAQVAEIKEFSDNLKKYIGTRGRFVQFAAGTGGLDFMLFLHESEKVLGCIRTGVVGENA